MSADMRLDAPMGAPPGAQEEGEVDAPMGAPPCPPGEVRPQSPAEWLANRRGSRRAFRPDRRCNPRPKQACKTKGLVEKRKVWLGMTEKTAGKLAVSALRKNLKTGRVVSTSVSQASLARYPHSKLKLWNVAMKRAREQLGFQGFVKMGKGEQGRQLLEATRSIRDRILLHGEEGAHGVQ